MRWFAMRFLDRVMWLSVGVMALSLIDGHAAGQCVEHKLLASDGAARDDFGYFVSISSTPGNEVAIVGARHDDDNGTDSGSAYIYRYDPGLPGWTEEAKLIASDGAADDRFSRSVSIRSTPGNKVAIVGAFLDDDNIADSGSAYIYRFNPDTLAWIEEAKLIASDGTAGDFLGFPVSISGDPGNEVVIVGAMFDDDNGTDSGSAYIYRYDPGLPGWTEEAKLIASDGAADDRFSRSVSIRSTPGNKVAIVGAFLDDDNIADSGSAYIYRFNPDTLAWIEEAKLIASDGEASDWFGYSVSISSEPGNEVAIVGAWSVDDNGTDSGSAYIYRFNGAIWVEETKLLASDGEASDWFGWSVSISGTSGNEVAIVGALLDNDNGGNSGSAYIYRYDSVTSGWVEELKLLASDGAASDFFGFSVSISGDPGNEVAIVGARYDDDNGTDSGSAYVFELTACPADTNCSGDVNVTDLLLLLGNWGPCPNPCPPDTNGDGNVNVTDLLALLAAWGACP